MGDLIPREAGDILRRADEKGILDVSGDTIYAMEYAAAQESIANGLYITWTPSAFMSIPASATDEIKSGIGQCCRVGSQSLCQCGHVLANHQQPKVPKKGYIKPPACANCKRCKQFAYSPSYPEECGQWWLVRRRDFNIRDWRKRVQSSPEEYACIGCNLKVSDHETVLETRNDRLNRSAAVDEQFIPLHNYRVASQSQGKS